MYSALIIDDEADARNVMHKLLGLFCPEITHISEAEDGEAAMQCVDENKYDFAFVDIQLNGESGIDLAKRIGGRCANIIFVTAYDEYAVQAFQTAAIHYLLKPVDPELLEQAISKAHLNPPAKNTLDGRLFLNTRDRMIVMKHDEISHIVGDGNYVTFYDLSGSSLMVSRNLSYYESLIGSTRFFRIHQTYLVNLAVVRTVRQAGRQGNWVVETSRGDLLPLARRRKEDFMKQLKNGQ